MRHNPETVIGWVKFYNDERGYGFAVVQGDSIFFHRSGGRRVTGNALKPVLTDEPSTQTPTHRGRTPSELIMKVVEGPKGPKAIAWGIMPRRTWIDDAFEYGNGPGSYVGGTVSLMVEYGEGKNRRATLKEAELTREQLTIHLTNIEVQEGYEFVPATPDEEVLTFPTGPYPRGGFGRDRRYFIRVEVEGTRGDYTSYLIKFTQPV